MLDLSIAYEKIRFHSGPKIGSEATSMQRTLDELLWETTAQEEWEEDFYIGIRGEPSYHPKNQDIREIGVETMNSSRVVGSSSVTDDTSNIICDGCGEQIPMNFKRWVCTICPYFDICKKCVISKARSGDHLPTHPLKLVAGSADDEDEENVELSSEGGSHASQELDDIANLFQVAPGSGVLRGQVIAAQELMSKPGQDGTCDAFVKVSFVEPGNQHIMYRTKMEIFTSKVVNDSIDPKWDQDYQIALEEPRDNGSGKSSSTIGNIPRWEHLSGDILVAVYDQNK